MINCHHRCLSLSLIFPFLGVSVKGDLGMKTNIKMCKSVAMGLHMIGKIRHFWKDQPQRDSCTHLYSVT